MAEKLSYKAFQRMFGRSIRDRAPGMFLDHLRRKAASAGGGVIGFPTRPTRLSQSCQCGEVVKKPLSQRWHDCSCGAHAKRDLYSAYLGLHVCEDAGTWKLDAESAREGWCAAESLLEKAVSGAVQAAKGGPLPASFGIRARDRAALSRRWNDAGEDPGCCSHVAVPGMARAGKTSVSSTRTPGFSRGEIQCLRAFSVEAA